MAQPLLRKGLNRAVGPVQLIRFLTDEFGTRPTIDKTDGDDVVALMEDAGFYVVTTRRVLVAGLTNEASIDVGEIGINQGAKQKTDTLGGVGSIYLHVLAHPISAAETAGPNGQVVLRSRAPVALVQIGVKPLTRDTGVGLL